MDKKYFSDKLGSMIDNFVNHIPLILSSIFIFVIFYVIADYYKLNVIPKKNNLMKSEQEQLMETEEGNENENLNNDLIYYQLSWIGYYSIIIFGLLVSLVNLGFNVVTIVTLLGSVGLALGLALQHTVTDIISGINIIINKLFKIGDEIILVPLGNTNPTFGKIVDFNLYNTTIVDSSTNNVSTIPNSIIQNNVLTNITLSEKIFSNDK
jgi:small-conductance mechanosensitive channel